MATSNPVNIWLIDHVVIRVRDPAAMVEFYRSALGCRLEKEQRGIGLSQLRAGAGHPGRILAEVSR